jgi:hypothetical protein
MTEQLEHEDVMELAVQLTCSYLGTSHSASTNAEDLILDYYRQIRNVERRLVIEPPVAEGGEREEETRAAA